MFAYCNNNPVTGSDPDGKRHIEHADVVGGSNSLYSGTTSVGVSASIPIGTWAVGGQLFVTTDSYNKTALQVSFYGNPIHKPSFDWNNDFSLLFFMMFTNAPSYRDLEGPGVSGGYAISSFPAIVVDYVGIQDPVNTEKLIYHGVMWGQGISSPGIHGSWGETTTLIALHKFNLYDFFNSLHNHMLKGGFV